MRPTTPVDPDLEHIDLPSGRLAYTDTGEGRAVVGIHGMPATHRDFRWLDAAFAGRVRFLRLDLPGLGESAPTAPLLPALAVAVIELLERLDLQDVVLVSHSMGGPVAIEVAASPRVGAVALVNSAGPILHRSMFSRTYRVLTWLADLHPLVAWLTVGTAKPVARWVGFSKHLSDAELLFATRVCATYVPERITPMLAALDKPVLVAWCADDPAVQPAVARELMTHAKHPTEVRFETGGHNLQSTMASELADAIVDWALS
jgi:pimeloyl-ACP methyl ester carboxylesterase